MPRVKIDFMYTSRQKTILSDYAKKCISQSFLILQSIVLIILVTGCASWKNIESKAPYISFHIETSPELPSAYSELIRIPVGGEHLYISPQPIIDTKDILNVELIQAEINSKTVYLFGFDLTPRGQSKLDKIRGADGMGRRIILKMNNQPISLDFIQERTSVNPLLIPTRMSLNDSQQTVLFLREMVKKQEKS